MKIAIGSDHAGFVCKERVKEFLQKKNIEFTDFGCFEESSVDYPDFAHKVASEVSSENFELGILICGSGQGVNMTANKYKQIRSALCWSTEIAELSRQHNNANVLCLPGRFLEIEVVYDIVEKFISTPFEGGRHQKRVDKISCLI